MEGFFFLLHCQGKESFFAGSFGVADLLMLLLLFVLYLQGLIKCKCRHLECHLESPNKRSFMGARSEAHIENGSENEKCNTHF